MPGAKRETKNRKQETLSTKMKPATSAPSRASKVKQGTASSEADSETQLTKWKFPVTIETFKKYMDYEGLLKEYIEKHEKNFKSPSEVQDLMLETIYMQYFTMPAKRTTLNLEIRKGKRCIPLVKFLLTKFAEPKA